MQKKRSLGQHFLRDEIIAQMIAGSLSYSGLYKIVLEIGPGHGALTRHLLTEAGSQLWLVELDDRFVGLLAKRFPALRERIIHQSFLNLDLESTFGKQVAVIGNFPYNISSQILFRVLKFKQWVPELVGMFQKEVAERICAKHSSKKYGILSVLIQAFYSTEYLFEVPSGAFDPPPKVDSAVIRLNRKNNFVLDCDEKQFFRIVKVAFNQRRKMLRNSLKQILQDNADVNPHFLTQRPEQLSVDDFIQLTRMIYPS